MRVGLGSGVTASNVRVDYDPVANRTCILFDATADEDAPGGDIGITVTFGGEVYDTEGGDPLIVVSGSGPAWSLHLGVADPTATSPPSSARDRRRRSTTAFRSGPA